MRYLKEVILNFAVKITNVSYREVWSSNLGPLGGLSQISSLQLGLSTVFPILHSYPTYHLTLYYRCSWKNVVK